MTAVRFFALALCVLSIGDQSKERIANKAAGIGKLTDQEVTSKILSKAKAGKWKPPSRDTAAVHAPFVSEAIVRAAETAALKYSSGVTALTALLCGWLHPITVAAMDAVLCCGCLKMLKDTGVNFKTLVMSSASGHNMMDRAIHKRMYSVRDLLLSWQCYGSTDTTTKEGIFRSAAGSGYHGAVGLMTKLKERPHSCKIHAAGADGLNAMDLAIHKGNIDVRNLLLSWQVYGTKTDTTAKEGIFRSAAMDGDLGLMTTLKVSWNVLKR